MSDGVTVWIGGMPYQGRTDVRVRQDLEPIYSDSLKPYDLIDGLSFEATFELADRRLYEHLHGLHFEASYRCVRSSARLRRRLLPLLRLLGNRKRVRRLLGVRLVRVEVTIPRVTWRPR